MEWMYTVLYPGTALLSKYFVKLLFVDDAVNANAVILMGFNPSNCTVKKTFLF